MRAKNITPIENCIFDLDGTLIDSFPEISFTITKAIARVIGESDVVIPDSMIGPPLEAILRRLLPGRTDEVYEEIRREFRTIYDTSDYSLTILYDGVRDILARLREMQCRLFLCTNKPSLPTRNLLDHFELQCFTDIMCGDTIKRAGVDKREMLSELKNTWKCAAARTAMVGDSPEDIFSAKSNHIVAVAYAGGYSSRDALIQAEPDYVINNLQELTTIVRETHEHKYI